MVCEHITLVVSKVLATISSSNLGIRSGRQSAWKTIGGGDQNHPQEEGNARRQSGCLRRPYKQLKKVEKWKAKEKGKDIPNRMQSFKE